MGAAESHDWLLEAEAAEHCRCSLWAFRKMGLPANDSGGRKVYSRQSLDLALAGRAWQRSTNAEAAGISTGGQRASNSADPSGRLKNARLRPYAPRKRQNSGG